MARGTGCKTQLVGVGSEGLGVLGGIDLIIEVIQASS